MTFVVSAFCKKPQKSQILAVTRSYSMSMWCLFISILHHYLIIGWEGRGSRTGPLGSGLRVGVDRGVYPESSNTPGFTWDDL